MGRIGLLTQSRFLDEDGQSESSRGHRGCEHRKGDQPLGPRVRLALVKLQPEVDQGAEGGDHGQREDDVICKMGLEDLIFYVKWIFCFFIWANHGLFVYFVLF